MGFGPSVYNQCFESVIAVCSAVDKINFGLQRNFRVGRFGPANILFRKQSNLF